jgi:diguanylate cyclase (GGDEF)-like protein/PAS domain S-box-containing protein
MPKQAEANLSALIESTEDLIWSVDLDYRLVVFNRAVQRTFEISYGVHVKAGMSREGLLPPERAVVFPSLYKRALSEGPFRTEYILRDGRTLELAFNPIVVDGETTGISVFGKDITERKAAEEERRFLAEVVETSEDAIISYSPSGIILTWNRGAEAVFGYSAEEAVGKHGHFLVAPERRRGMDEYTADLLRGNAIPQREGIGVRKDGQRIRVSVTAWPVRNLAGNQTAVSIIVRDVTKRMEAEDAMSLLASIVESSEDAIHAVRLDGTVVSWNRGAEELSGYSSQEVIGKSVAMLAPASRQQEVRECLETIVNGMSVSSFDTVIQRKDGCEIDVSISISPIRNPAGEVIGASAIIRDISRRKQSVQALQEAEKKYRDIFDGALEGMYQTSLEGRPLAGNPAGARILGYDTVDEVLSALSDTAKDVWVDPDERARFLQQIAEHGAVRGFECRFRRKDGTIIWVSLSSRLVSGTNGQPPSIEGFVEDITERRQTEEALRVSLDSLKEAQTIGGLGSYVLDIGTGVWTSSDVLDGIFGIDKSYAHTVESWSALIHPRDHSMMVAYFTDEVVANKEAFNKEYRIIRQTDLAERWVHGRGRLEFDARGRPIKMHGIIKDITERKLSEMQLRDSEERYRFTFEQAAVGIVHASFDGRYLRCNARFAEIIGYPQEEIPGMTLQQITVPEDQAESELACQQLADGAPGTSILEKPYLRKDGSVTWVKVTASTQRDAEGRALYFIALVEDINARKATDQRLAAATEALRLSEAHYRTLFQTSVDGIALSQMSDGKYIDANTAILRLMGYEREEIIGRTSLELNHWADPEVRQEMVAELRKHFSFRDIQTRFIRKSGELVWVLISATLIEIEGVPCILSVIRDISDAKVAEQRLAAAQEALRASEERYRATFQLSIDAININRLSDGVFVDVNEAFLDFVGYGREEVIGRTSRDLNFWVDPDDRQRMVETLRQNGSCRDLEARFRRRNGEVVWGQMSESIIEIEGVPNILSVTRDVSAAKAAEEQIRDLAFYDPLTHLPNRRLLMERLRQSLAAGARSNRKRALLFVDLDNFKNLNDTLGHQTGDLLLQEVAVRLSACVREADTVARLGGDEFVVMLEDLSDHPEEAAAQAEIVGEKILAAVDQPFWLSGRECLSTSSIGITVFGDMRESTNEILQQADIAMYQAKAAGRNTMRFFAPALQAAVNARAALEEDIRQAIKTGQFVLYYQPQLDCAGLIGAEALIRWKHPRRGLLISGEFIPLSEETGLILPLGDWVLESACAQIAAWAERPETAHISLAVNISARQFRHPGFVDKVLATLRRTGANPRNLKLELTESMLVENIEDIIVKMTDLKSHGLGFSLDDFGTG